MYRTAVDSSTLPPHETGHLRHASQRAEAGSPLTRAVVLALLMIGLIARIAPLFNHNGRLLQQFPTEDGYLMLTIARNMAIGNGMSTADGTIPTNGTQPLMTFIYAAGFWLVDGDKAGGVLVAQIIQIAISLLAAWLLYRLGRLVFAAHPHGRTIAALAAAVWFAAPLCVQHSQNCLETGAYAAAVLAVVLNLLAGLKQATAVWPIRKCLTLGALCGLAFWVRNDASLLILACCLTLAGIGMTHGPSLQRRLLDAFIVGTTSVVVALPWLLHNHIRFGSIVPVSGQAEAAFIPFGANASLILWALTEHILLVGGIPSSLEGHAAVLVACTLVLATTAIIVALLWREARTLSRILIALTLLYAAGITLFYGLYFGAGYFMSRYTYPLSPLFALLWAVVVCHICQHRRSVAPIVAAAVWGPVLAVIIALNVRTYAKGDSHQHFHVVRWVEDNVPEDVWVGAPQTGTLGFFHDRTINLDGKVNPEALKAKLKDQIPGYVLDKNIRYVADWVGLAIWMEEYPEIRDNFRIAVRDPHRNVRGLTVLERTTQPETR